MAKKKKASQPTFSIENKMENVAILNKTNRPKEAIAYLYLIYTDLVNIKFGQPRAFHETLKDYAITCVTKLNQNPGYIYPFIQKIEEIIYGGVEPTEDQFKATLRLFARLYFEITGKEFRV